MIRAGRGRIRARCGRLIPLAAVLLLGTSPATLIAQSPRAVTVIGLDYAFQAPDTLPAGPATLSLLNRGTVRHELILYLLNEGRNPGEFLRSTLEERLSMGRRVPAGARRLAAGVGRCGAVVVAGGRNAGRAIDRRSGPGSLVCISVRHPGCPRQAAACCPWDGESSDCQVRFEAASGIPPSKSRYLTRRCS